MTVCEDIRVNYLFHVDSFRRAGIHAGLAVYAHVLVDFGLLVLHGNRGCGAFAYAGLATGTFCCINNCNQYFSLHRYNEVKDKK